MANEDRDLVERCLRGSPSAYREFVERFETTVFGLCLRNLGNRHDAEDASQEVFIRAFRGLPKWDPNRPLRPWLLAITVNRCRTYLGKRRTMPVTTPNVEDPAVHDPDTVGAKELRDHLESAMATLRPEYRQVVHLFHEQSCSYEEMSQTIGKPIGTIKTWLHRARAEMLTFLRDKGLVPEVSHDVTRV